MAISTERILVPTFYEDGNMHKANLEAVLARFQVNHDEDFDLETVEQRIEEICEKYQPRGLALHEVQVLDSSACGTLTLVPYGGSCTMKELPKGPYTLTGLGSGTGSTIMYAEFEESGV